MFKLFILVAVCSVMLVEAMPAQNADAESVDNSRVARSAQYVQEAMRLGGQVANLPIQAATKGMNIASETAQQGISAASSIGANAAQKVGGMI